MKKFIEENLLNKSGKLNSRRMNFKWFVDNDKVNEYHEIHKDKNREFRDCVLDILYGDLHCAVCGERIMQWKNGDASKLKNTSYCSMKCAMYSDARKEKVYVKRSEETERKIRETCLERYGAETPFHSTVVQQKVRDTVESRYGVTNVSQLTTHEGPVNAAKTRNTHEWKLKARQKLLQEKDINPCEYTHDKVMAIPYNKRLSREFFETFLGGFDTVNDDQLKDLSLSVRYKHFKRAGGEVTPNTLTQWHRHFIRWLEELNIEFIVEESTIIKPQRLDLYIPEKRLAIELHGSYWHSEERVGRNYHRDKERVCREAGVKLVSVYEWQDLDKIKSYLSSKLLPQQRIHARALHIVNVKQSDYKEFCEQNHIDGYSSAKVIKGLIDDDGKLFQVMSFSKSRFDSKYDWELIRFCSLSGYRVTGGASKLLTNFRREHSGSIMTYSSLDRGKSTVYESIGFEKVGETPPSYNWTRGNITLSRYQTQKSKLAELLGDKFDPTLTEDENMTRCRFIKVYKCGNEIFEIGVNSATHKYK